MRGVGRTDLVAEDPEGARKLLTAERNSHGFRAASDMEIVAGQVGGTARFIAQCEQ